MKHMVVLGTQWGDEGKGKIVDMLARRPSVGAVVRYQGGDNAGHTVVAGGKKHALHLLPSGILHESTWSVIGNGVIINPETLLSELETMEQLVGKQYGKLFISEKSHLIMPWHRVRDGISGGAIGTTGRGIGPTYTDAVARRGIRVMDLVSKTRFFQRVEEEREYNRKMIEMLLDYYGVKAKERKVVEKDFGEVGERYWRVWGEIMKRRVSVGDAGELLEEIERRGKAVLFEGAQATLLDIAHGTYPFVTSSYPTFGGTVVGTGFRAREPRVIGVAKAYTTRVGEGPFPSELNNKTGERLREVGGEYGTTTGRPRRCGWLDLVILEYAKRVNGLDALAITKLDVLSGIATLKVAVGYSLKGKKLKGFEVDSEKLTQVKVEYAEMSGWKEDITKIRSFEKLPINAQKYIRFIEKRVGTRVAYIGVGPGREQVIRHA
jgi:adenylosuccinate synthase